MRFVEAAGSVLTMFDVENVIRIAVHQITVIVPKTEFRPALDYAALL